MENKNKNICKFNLNRSSDLICTDFIYETNCAQGTIFFVPKGESFRIKGSEDFAYFYICFHGRRADELVERIGFCDEFCVFETGEAYAQIAEFGFHCLHKANSENLDMLSESVLLYLLAHLNANKKPHSDLIAQIVMLTQENFSDAAFSLSALAETLGYDAKYLSFLWKKKKGICFTQYLRDLRIKRAVFLMEQGVVSVKNIAILSGFGDALYFSKIFKQAMGTSPKNYMEKLAKGN